MTEPHKPKQRFTLKEVNGTDDAIARVLRDMHRRVFDDSAPQIDPSEGYWWIAWKGDTAAGFAGLKLSVGTPGTAYLHRSGVLPYYRGNGLQQRFVKVREAKARELGMGRMVTDTTENIHSANNLMSCGYRLYRPEGKWAYTESLYWQKPL